MHFDVVTGKIATKLNDSVIYGEILVNFLIILSTKSTISHEIVFHALQHIVHLFIL